ncbi:MAG: hypothetical protein WCR52_04660 [Bacteroidota bacterium]
MKPQHLFPLVFTLLSLFSCRKEDNTPGIHPAPPTDYTVLPPATQEGKNTFGCKVNGKVWVPRVPWGAVTYTDLFFGLDESGGTGYGHGVCNLVDLDEKIEDWLSIGFGPSHFLTGDYCSAPDDSIEPRFSILMRRIHDYYEMNESKIDCTNRFTLTKIDTVKNFISGTFEFTLYNSQNPSDSLKITEGRFDLLYYPE